MAWIDRCIDRRRGSGFTTDGGWGDGGSLLPPTIRASIARNNTQSLSRLFTRGWVLIRCRSRYKEHALCCRMLLTKYRRIRNTQTRHEITALVWRRKFEKQCVCEGWAAYQSWKGAAGLQTNTCGWHISFVMKDTEANWGK